MNEYFTVIGKRPIKGFSKTRLAKTIGEDQSIEIYHALILDFFSHFNQHSGMSSIYFYGAPFEEETKEYFLKASEKLTNSSFHFDFQTEESFFQRIASLLKKYNEEDWIHLTGTDVAAFPYHFLKPEQVKEGHVLIGPDRDGGFYYFGGEAKSAHIFKNLEIVEGGKSVCEALQKACEKDGLVVDLLPPWSDIDTFDDLERSMIEHGKGALPESYRYYNSYLKETKNP